MLQNTIRFNHIFVIKLQPHTNAEETFQTVKDQIERKTEFKDNLKAAS